MSLGRMIGVAFAQTIISSLGSFQSVENRKRQERKALAWLTYKRAGKPDDWPVSPQDDNNECTEHAREHFLATAGPEGMQRVVGEFERYVMENGMDGILIDQLWRRK